MGTCCLPNPSQLKKSCVPKTRGTAWCLVTFLSPALISCAVTLIICEENLTDCFSFLMIPLTPGGQILQGVHGDDIYNKK